VAQRAYELFESRGCKDGHNLEDWLCAERELLVPMPIEVSEYDDSFIVQAQVADFNETELEISVEPRRLYVSGRREQPGCGKTGGALYSDVHPNEAFRAVDLPTEVDRDNVGLSLRDGSLYIVLRKLVSGIPAAK
jgi:HSP20 family molecular chaperone IbpA